MVYCKFNECELDSEKWRTADKWIKLMTTSIQQVLSLRSLKVISNFHCEPERTCMKLTHSSHIDDHQHCLQFSFLFFFFVQGKGHKMQQRICKPPNALQNNRVEATSCPECADTELLIW